MRKLLLISLKTAKIMYHLQNSQYSPISFHPSQAQALSQDRFWHPYSDGFRFCYGWIIGGLFFGAVQDFGALYASVKNEGKSMGMLIEKYIGKTGRKLFMLFCLLSQPSQIWLQVLSMHSR